MTANLESCEIFMRIIVLAAVETHRVIVFSGRFVGRKKRAGVGRELADLEVHRL
jgi:hypothetical protein